MSPRIALLADLPALLASPPAGPIALCVPTTTADDALEVVRLLRKHRRPLARVCVGVALVADGAARDVAIEWAGRVTVPFTALPTKDAALAWLDGQLTVGLRGVRPRGGSRGIGLPPWVQDYVEAQFNPPSDRIAARLAADTRQRFPDGAGMCIGESQGRLMQLLVELSGARDIVEVGTFTGSSALWMARGLPADGRLTCFEIDPEPIELARAAWQAAGVSERITVTLGPAAENLAKLPAEPCIDVGFVDADKGATRPTSSSSWPACGPTGSSSSTTRCGAARWSTRGCRTPRRTPCGGSTPASRRIRRCGCSSSPSGMG